MKLSISNIAWDKSYDEQMYQYINEIGFTGLEIAPTRIFPRNPYEKLEEAKTFSGELKKKYNLDISSMQSIWYGKEQELFGSAKEREELIEYTKKAIDFANVIGCRNLVFGCPKNRNMESPEQYVIAIEFFNTLGYYAKEKDTVLAIEPNPTIYNTNFINYTYEAFKLVKDINNQGIKVNIDLGTIIQNEEEIEFLSDNINLVNHIHISEPNLNEIVLGQLHKNLACILKEVEYEKYVSIEMKNLNDINRVKNIMNLVRNIFVN